MLHFLKDLFTCKDGVSFDVGRVAWVGMCLSLIFFEGFAVIYHSQVFDPQAFAIGAGAVLAAGGAALGLKRLTEPQGESATTTTTVIDNPVVTTVSTKTT